MRSGVRVAAWNLALLAAGGAALFVVVEAWLRATTPFVEVAYEPRWAPGVGTLRKAHSEVRWTNLLDHWTVSRTNRFGFLDRELPSPELARASCHVAVVGDSFVAGREVPLRDRLQVRLEELAARRLPEADVTTAGWGRPASGQVQQLSFWDKWIREFSPKLVVLVFVDNDMDDNRRRDRGAWASRSADGRLVLRLPDVPASSAENGGGGRASRRPAPLHLPLFVRRWREASRRLPVSPPVPMRPDATPFTVFALDQWRSRTQEAGASLVVLATHTMRRTAVATAVQESQFDWLAREAAIRRIPLVDQLGYVVGRGRFVSDAHWANDFHWNPQGHQWAAEAMLEWLERNPQVCGA